MSSAFRLRAAALPLAAMLLAGCFAGGGPRPVDAAPPAWYSRPPQESGRLFAVGSAGPGDRDHAVAKARSDLVSQLRLTIKSQTTTSDDYSSQEATGASRAERLAQSARSDVQARAAAEDIPGITVVEQVDRPQTTYVLLRLDREAWAADLRADIAELDRRLPGEAAAVTALPTATPAQRIQAAGAHIRRLLPLLVQRDELLTRLRLALPGRAMPPDAIDRAGLDRRLADLLADLTVALPPDPSVASLAPQLVDSLRGVGLRSVAAGQPSVLVLPLILTTRVETIGEQIRIDGRLSGSLRLAPEAGGTELGGIAISERASSLREDVARERLAQKLAKQLAADLDQRLTRMLAGN